MTSAIEPLVVYDCHDKQWRGDPDVLSWMRAEQLDPELVYRLEVYVVDCPSARVYEYATVLGARIFVPALADYMRREPYDVILASLPPEAPALPEEKR
ncbi:hypothetical protein ACIBEJ_34895 [Nonomuraea sp. NPDC050790]|uniref:hypothetical protein n=1 Tax=Nonomuraea sp. NPDC050790 TaxID=3364371 RepID=UPI0037AAA2CD